MDYSNDPLLPLILKRIDADMAKITNLSPED